MTPASLEGHFSKRRLLLGILLAPLLVALSRHRTVLRIDATAIHDRRLTRDAIAWGEVRALQPVTYNAQHYVVIIVVDAAAKTAGAGGESFDAG